MKDTTPAGTVMVANWLWSLTRQEWLNEAEPIAQAVSDHFVREWEGALAGIEADSPRDALARCIGIHADELAWAHFDRELRRTGLAGELAANSDYIAERADRITASMPRPVTLDSVTVARLLDLCWDRDSGGKLVDTVLGTIDD